MFCANCGNELSDEAVHCPFCGEKVDGVDVSIPSATNFVGQQSNNGVGARVSSGEMRNTYQMEQNENSSRCVSNLIIDPNEQQISVIRGSYFASLIRGGGLNKGLSILTDKRFYFKGRSFTKWLGFRVFVNQEYVIDLEDISATGFVYVQRFWLLILGIINAIGWIVALFATNDDETIVLGGIVTVPFLVAYFLTKRVYYEVYFDSGYISVDVSKYGGMREVKTFNKALRLEKDKCKRDYMV